MLKYKKLIFLAGAVFTSNFFFADLISHFVPIIRSVMLECSVRILSLDKFYKMCKSIRKQNLEIYRRCDELKLLNIHQK